MTTTSLEIVIRANGRGAMSTFSQVGQSAGRAEQQVSRFGKAVQFAANATLALGGIARVGRMAARAFAEPINVAAEFEDKMARVGALSDASAKDMADLTRTARTLGKETRFSAIQAAEGLENLATAGFTARQQMEALPGVLNLAAANATDIAVTSEIAADALHGFGLKTSAMGRVADVLSKGAAESTTNLVGIGDALKYAAPIARTAGADIEQVTAAVGLLANVGIKGSSAGTALRAMFLRLSAPTGKLKKQAEDAGEDVGNVGKGRDALRFLGIDPNDKNGNVRPFAQLLTEIQAAVKAKALGSGDKLALYKKIFGEEAASAAAELIERAGDGALDGMIDKMREAEGTTSKLADKMNDTAKGAFENLKGAIEDVEIELGNAMIPTLRALSTELVASSEQVGSWASENKQDLQALSEVVGGVTSVVFGLVEMVAKAYVGFTRLGKIIGDTMANSDLLDFGMAALGKLTGNDSLVDAARGNQNRKRILSENGGAEYVDGPAPSAAAAAEEAGKRTRPATMADAMRRAREAGIEGEEAQRQYAITNYRPSDAPTVAGSKSIQMPAQDIEGSRQIVDVNVELHDKRTVVTAKPRERGARVSTAAGPALAGSQ